MVNRNQHRGYSRTGPNKDRAVLIWHYRVHCQTKVRGKKRCECAPTCWCREEVVADVSVIESTFGEVGRKVVARSSCAAGGWVAAAVGGWLLALITVLADELLLLDLGM